MTIDCSRGDEDLVGSMSVAFSTYFHKCLYPITFFYKEDLMLAFAKYGAKFRVRTFSKRFASEQKRAVPISGTQKNPIEIAFWGTTSEENPRP